MIIPRSLNRENITFYLSTVTLLNKCVCYKHVIYIVRMGSGKKHSSLSLVHPYQWNFCMGWVMMGNWMGLMPTLALIWVYLPPNDPLLPHPHIHVDSLYMSYIRGYTIKAG